MQENISSSREAKCFLLTSPFIEPADAPFRFDEATIERGLNFTLDTDIGPLDLLGEVAGLGSYDAVRASSETIEVYGRNCQILSLDGLIKAKRD